MANNNSLNNTSYGFTLPSLNLNFTSTAQRITGDMSNGTHANRLAFQSSTVNGATSLFILPNGTSVTSSIICANASDPTNSAFAQMQIDATSVKLVSSVLGTGVQLPMEIRIGATAAININTSRAVSIANTVVGNVPLTITGTTSGGITINQTPVATALTLNGTSTAGTYAQQNNAYVASGLFSAFRALNVDGTAGGSCQIEVSVFGQLAATGGDATLLFGNYGGTNIKIGNDVSVNQFSMSTGNLGDANTFFSYDVVTTQINLPRQCAFSYSAAAQPNVTGAGGIYTVAFANINYNVGVAVNAVFTNFAMPKTGKYLISIQIVANGIAVGMTLGYFQLYKNGVAFRDYAYVNPFVVQAGGTYIFSGTSLLSLTTGDVLAVVFYINGGAGNTVGIPATTSAYISGQLLS
jgi:hypothetical protein